MKIVHLRGSWHEMGCQYGVEVRQELHHVYHFLETKADTPEKLQGVEATAEKLFSHYPDELRQFFDGMAETSGLTEHQLRIVNAVEYSEAAFMCSGLAVWGDYSKDGQVLYGRNYDEVSYLPLHSNLLVTVYHPTGCQWAATIGYAGEIYALNGINESGIFLELNNGMPSAGFDINYDISASTTELLRLLFTARTLDDVDRFFNETESFASFIIGVADGKEARSYEWCQHGVKRGDKVTPDGLMIQTNHYLNPEWTFPVPDDAHSWQSHTRRQNMLSLAEALKGSIDADRLQSIIQTPIAEGGPMFLPNKEKQPITLYQLVVSPSIKTLWVRITEEYGWTCVRLG